MTESETTQPKKRHLLRIPREYALQVAPVASICILLAFFGQRFYPILCALLSVWFWLQWPRRRLSYIAFLLAVLLLSIVPAISLLYDTLRFESNNRLRPGASLCDCWIALLVSTALAIATRMSISWRFVDTQIGPMSGDQEPSASSRGSVLDLIAAVSAFAGVFALMRYRLEGDFGYSQPHVLFSLVIAVLSTLSAVAFIRLFAPLSGMIQAVVTPFASLLMVGVAWVGMEFAASVAGESYRSELPVAIIVSTVVFAALSSLCGLRLYGFEVRRFGPATIRFLALTICIVAVGGLVIATNAGAPYGPMVGESPALLGWPAAHSHLAYQNPGAYSPRPFRVGSVAGFAMNIFVGVAFASVFGGGIATVLCNLFSRKRKVDSAMSTFWRRSSVWLAMMAATFVAFVVLSCLNVRSLIVDSQFEERPYAEKVYVARASYALHPGDRMTAQVIQWLGYEVPDEVIVGVDVQEVMAADQMQEICSLPELTQLKLPAETNTLPIECVDSLVIRNRLYSLTIGKAPLSKEHVDKITQIRSLVSFSAESPLPNTEVYFSDQIGDLDIDLTQCTNVVRFPQAMQRLEMKVSDETDLTGFRGTYNIDRTILDCSRRTLAMDFGVRHLSSFVLLHGDHDVQLNLSAEMYEIDLVADRVPGLQNSNGRQPNVSISLGTDGYFRGGSFKFLDASCSVTDFRPGTVWSAEFDLQGTRDFSLADQLESMPADLRYELTLKGSVDDRLVRRLSEFKNLKSLQLKATPSPGTLPLEALEKSTFADLRYLTIEGAALTERQLDFILRASPSLRGIQIDGSLITRVNLSQHVELESFVVLDTVGLRSVEFGARIPDQFVVTRAKALTGADIVVQGDELGRTVLQRVSSEEYGGVAQIEAAQLEATIWSDVSFGELINSLEIDVFPSVEMLQNWRFGEGFNTLLIHSDESVPPDLLPVVFKNKRENFLADFGLGVTSQYYWRPREGHALSLENRDITPALIDALEQIETLRSLYLSGAKVTAEQVTEIKARCPWIEHLVSPYTETQ